MLRPFAIAALSTTLATPALAFLAQNDLVVRDLGGAAFEVKYRGLSGPSDFWCAAGDYVVRHLDKPGTTRIYRLSSPPRRAGQGIEFSLQPDGAKPTGLAIWGNGRGVTAAHARQLCDVPSLLNQD